MAIVKELPSFSGKRKWKFDKFVIFDSVEDLAAYADALPEASRGYPKSSWTGGQSYDESLAYCRKGDLSRVAPSDKYMRQFEDLIGYESRAFRTIADVAGGMPNVPAYLTGQPLAMRRRARVQSEQAPLAIVVDLASSGGIEAKHLERRGAAVLAIVRLLSAIRPISLHAVVAALPMGLGYEETHEYGASCTAIRIETAPLDLARAAHVLGAVSTARQICYSVVTHSVGMALSEGCSLAWAYNDVNKYRACGAELWKQALQLDDILFLAPAFIDDPAIDNPERFVRDMLAKYGRAAD